MSELKIKSKVVLSVLCAAVLLLACTCLYHVLRAYLERSQAEQALKLLARVEVGTTKESTVRSIFAPLTNRIETLQDGVTTIEFAYNNAYLVRLRLAPYTDFRATLVLKDGIVVEKVAQELNADTGTGARVSERLRGVGFLNGIAPADYPAHIVNNSLSGQPGEHRVSVDDDITYEKDLRDKDWNFNVKCLTMLGGCDDARVMLPNIPPTTHHLEVTTNH